MTECVSQVLPERHPKEDKKTPPSRSNSQFHSDSHRKRAKPMESPVKLLGVLALEEKVSHLKLSFQNAQGRRTLKGEVAAALWVRKGNAQGGVMTLSVLTYLTPRSPQIVKDQPRKCPHCD